MMHYKPWVHPQVIMDNQRYYAQHMDELSQFHQRSEPIEEYNEQTTDEMHDTMTSATSGERSPSADIFRLEFAATQWSKLVSNAEGLFNQLIVSNILPHTEQDQIEQWLCLKQEYEECITSDDAASFQGLAENTRRSLDIIEEVTETEEKTDESGNRVEFHDRSDSCSEFESEISEEDDEDEDQSDTTSENPDFVEKLDECMNKFKAETDRLIELKKDEFKEASIPINSSLPQMVGNYNESVPIVNPIPRRNPNMRRNSMMPGSEMSNGLLAFNDTLKLAQNQNIQTNSSNRFTATKYTEVSQNLHVESQNDTDEIAMRPQTNNSPNLLMVPLRNSDNTECIKELNHLTKSNKAKQNEIMKIEENLQLARKQMKELQSKIEFKESFLSEMIENSYTWTSVKDRFQRKRRKLKEEYYNTKAQLTQARSGYNNTEERAAHNMAIEQYENCKQRLKEVEKIIHLAEDSAKVFHKNEVSLFSFKQQMEQLKSNVQKEEHYKKQLEDEIAIVQRKIREWEDKYRLTASRLKEMQSESEDEVARSRNKSTDNKKNLLDVSARISHLDHVLKEKSMDLEKTADTEEKEALRHEIRNLRSTRDCLIEEKCDLDGKFPKGTVEERELFECVETIEAIDAMIEHKNEMICGRKAFAEDVEQIKNGDLVLENLAKLTDGEMKNIFQKYFKKVIDLKQNLKNLEDENMSLEKRLDEAEKQNQYLTARLAKSQRETEMTLFGLEKNFEREKFLMIKYIDENSSQADHDKMGYALTRYRMENETLKKRLQEAEAGQKLRGTKITRKKNKLIIQKK